MALSLSRTATLSLCAALALSSAAGCGLLKKKDKSKEDTSSTTTETKGDNAPTTTSEGDDPPADKPYKGCKMPNGDIHADWTVTKGCKTKLKSNFYVQDGATLTIEAGVRVEFETDTFLWVEYGKLIVAGTEKEPVVFTSANKSPSPGDYVGIGFREKVSAGTSIDHLHMEYAGSKASSGQGAISLESMKQPGRVSITNSRIEKSAQFAVTGDDNGGFAKFENNVMTDNKSGSLHVRPEAVASIGAGNKFGAEIHVKDGAVDESGRWPSVDVPFLIEGNIRVGSDSKAATLTLPEKATLKIAQGTYFEVAHDGTGALVAKGVTFTSASPSPAEGDWGTVFLYPKSNGTDLEGCTFEYFGNDAGSGKGAITIWSTSAKSLSGVTIKDNTFRKGKVAAMTSDDGLCAPFDKANNTVDGVPLCNKP